MLGNQREILSLVRLPIPPLQRVNDSNNPRPNPARPPPRIVRRRLRAMRQRERKGQLGKKAQAQLRGWEALASMVARQHQV